MRLHAWIAAAFGLLASALTGLATSDQAEALWSSQIEPLLDRNCFKCHGGVRQKSGIDLRSLENILRGGDRGPGIVPGQPEQSHLYQFVLKGGDPHMPQDEKKQLKDPEIAAIGEWIRALPGTNLVGLASTNQAVWAEAYVKKFRSLQTRAWTPPDDLSTHQVIDGFIELGWKQRHVVPSGLVDDAGFARRIYLDLAGRIPTTAALERFLADRQPGKRARLIDDLLEGDDYPRHMREVFDVVLMERRDQATVDRRRDQGWFTFLEHAFRENYAWDRIVRELVVARPLDPQDRGAVWFLYERKNNYQALAEALAPIAFGVQINCAQCHNHPLAAEVEQRHYWGLVTALNRSKNVEASEGVAVAESAIGGFINFANLKKESQPAQLAFLNGVLVPELRPAESEKEVDSPERYVVPPPPEKEKPVRASVPKFSRREALAQAITHNNPQLARAFVNRIWAMLMGRGLVQSVDQLDSRHRPSHPDLLNWLARDFEESGYDIKRLISEIALSRTYQLDSRPSGNTQAPPEAFARALEKPLSSEQLYHSFLVATGNTAGPDGSVAGLEEQEIRRAFSAQFPDLFPLEYNASLQQATFLSNSPILDELLQSRGSNTVARMLAQTSDEARVQLAFQAVLGRKPDAEEMAACLTFLQDRSAEAGARQLLWAVLASTEFQMIH